MADRLLPIADGFWNVRGSFKLGGHVDIGTQTSLVRLHDRSFALLDAYTLRGEVKERIFGLTDGGRAISSVLHLHPFHTLHVEAVAALLPHAVHYGSARHRARAPGVRWSELSIEHPELHARFAEDFDFMVPRGVPFIAKDQRLHFSSVLAFHKHSRTLHVDDTLTFTPVPLVGGLGFHLTLPWVLERRPGAVADFRAWAEQLAVRCRSVDHIVTAHARPLPRLSSEGPGLEAPVRRALQRTELTLRLHERRWGRPA